MAYALSDVEHGSPVSPWPDSSPTSSPTSVHRWDSKEFLSKPGQRRARRISIASFPPPTRHHSPSSDDESPVPPYNWMKAGRPPWYMARIKRKARHLCRRQSCSRSRYHLIRAFLLTTTIAFVVLFLVFVVYEPHIEISLYSRRWIKHEVDSLPPLAGCFNTDRDADVRYNVTEHVWMKTSRWDVHAGVDMMRGMDCYNFAGMIQEPGPVHERNHLSDGEDIMKSQPVAFHTYWRTDLASFGPRQECLLQSFFTTQPLPSSRLILWSNGDLSTNTIIRRYIDRFPESFTVQVVDIPELAKGTALEGSRKLDTQDEKAWVDGDLIRLLVLWKYGGVWVDMDSLFTRSLRPLLEHEFVTQWDCYDKPYTPLNGALMHFHAHSGYLCEAFHLMASSPPPRRGSTDWGSLLYTKLWRALVRGGVPPFKVLPWCFSDGRSCRIDNRLPDPFEMDGEGEDRWSKHSSLSGIGLGRGMSERDGKREKGVDMGMEEGGMLEEVLGKVFSVHLHNQWEKKFPTGGWVERLLLKKYKAALSDMG